VAGRSTPQKLVWRARIVLMWAQRGRRYGDHSGDRQDQANRLPLAGSVFGARRRRSRTRRDPGRGASRLWRRPRSSASSPMTLNEKPPKGTPWSLRKLAKAVGLSHSVRSASRRRQLRKPQAPQGRSLAQAPSSLPPPLHPDIGLLDQSGRTLLRLDRQRRHPPRRLPQRRRT
jgi:hypothetical protein